MSLKPKERTKNYVKELILNSDGIGRAEISEKAELDIRTATAYAEELCQQGIAMEEKINTNGRGRPSILYRPDLKNLRFAGLVFRVDLVECVLTDYDGNIIKKDSISVNLENEAKLTVVNKITNQISRYINFSESGRLTAIGFAFTRWLKPPLSASDIYHDLPDIVNRATGIPVFCELPISVCTYHVRSLYPEMRNILVIHPVGRVLELGIQIDGHIPPDVSKREYEFYHTSVNSEGSKCYCGQNGCLGNYVTLGALLEDYKIRSGRSSRYDELMPLAANGDPAAVESCHHLMDMLWEGIKKISAVYQPGIINIIGISGMLFERINANIKKENRTDIRVADIAVGDLAFAAARMAAFISVINFKNKDS